MFLALGRWLAETDQPPKRKVRCSSFDVEPGAFPRPVDPDEQEAAAWYASHFRLNGRPWDGER